MIRWPHNNRGGGRGRPYVYPPTVILRCFIVRVWFRLDSNRALHEYLATEIGLDPFEMRTPCNGDFFTPIITGIGGHTDAGC